jgi:hypothetical protein
MNSVTILRNLWRRRPLVLLALAVAFAAGWIFAFELSFPPKPRSYTVGEATVNILVDTPKSQVIDVAPKGSDTLAARANVLANLMVDGEIKDAIARQAGVSRKKIIGSAPSPDGSVPPPVLNQRSLAYTTSVLLTSDMAELPIIKVQTQAPDVGKALMLANAAVKGLSDYLDTKAADETIDATRRLRVRALGVAQGNDAPRGPARIMALVVVLFVFLGGCASILVISALASKWRAVVAEERDVFDEDDQVAASEPRPEEDEGLELEDWADSIEEPLPLRASS